MSAVEPRKPLAELTEDEFLTDLVAFLQEKGHKLAPPGSDADTFPQRTLNGAKLDLFGLYKSVVIRGGFPTKERLAAGDGKLNWTRDIFPSLSNFTEGHKATSVGHDLIGHYQNYLYEYELAHPQDVISDPNEIAAATAAFERTAPRPVVKLPGRVSARSDSGGGGGGGGGRGRGRGRGRPGRPRGSGGGRWARGGRGGRGGRRGRAKVRTAEDFAVGCRVKVFWVRDNAWYAGVIEDQQTAEGIVYSKVAYDDGDVEVLDLLGGSEQVVLLTRADGTPASDAEEDLVNIDEDEDTDDDGLGGLAIPISSRRAAKEGLAVYRGDRSAGASPTQDVPETSARPASGSSRRAAAKARRGASDQNERSVGIRRNPLRAAMAANLAPHQEFPPSDAKIESVLMNMRANDAARVLADLPYEQEPSGEVYRLGYKMGARRAIACCAAAVAAAAATAASSRGGTHAKGITTPRKGRGVQLGSIGTTRSAPSTGDAAPATAEDPGAGGVSAAAVSHEAGVALRESAAKEGGAWTDPLASAAAHPALAHVLRTLEEILAKEVFDPDLFDDDEVSDEEDETVVREVDEVVRNGIDLDTVNGVLGVNPEAEKARVVRATQAGSTAPAKNESANDRTGTQADAEETHATRHAHGVPTPAAAPSTSAVAVEAAGHATGIDEVKGAAAYFAEAARKRAIADAELARIVDPVKLAAVQADAFQQKPTTTAGRLIKAANNAKQRAEREASREAAGGAPKACPAFISSGRIQSSAKVAAASATPPAFMVKSGEGNTPEELVFKPPLGKTASMVASEAFAVIKGASGGATDSECTPEWGDGGRTLAGDHKVVRWLQRRGWGEYAAAFVAYGVTRDSLPKLSMQDLENIPVDGADIRATIHGAISVMGTDNSPSPPSKRRAPESSPHTPSRRQRTTDSPGGAKRQGTMP